MEITNTCHSRANEYPHYNKPNDKLCRQRFPLFHVLFLPPRHISTISVFSPSVLWYSVRVAMFIIICTPIKSIFSDACSSGL